MHTQVLGESCSFASIDGKVPVNMQASIHTVNSMRQKQLHEQQ